MLRVRLRPATGRAHGEPVTNARQNVLELASRRHAVEHLHAGSHRNPVTLGTLAKKRLLTRLASTPMPRGERIQPIAERVAQISSDEIGLGESDEKASIAAP